MAGADASSMIGQYAGGGATTTLGAVQLAYGMYLADQNKRPTYEIPKEIQQNLTEANMRALQGLPEQQKQEYLNNLQKSTAYNLNNASDLKSGLIGTTGANNAMNAGYGNLMSADAQARMQNQNLASAQRQNMADYKEKEWQLNKQNPYYEMVAYSQGLEGAGMQNISQGFQAGNTGGNAFAGNQKSTPSAMNNYNTAPVNTSSGYVPTQYAMSPYQYGAEANTPMTTPNYAPTQAELTGTGGRQGTQWW